MIYYVKLTRIIPITCATACRNKAEFFAKDTFPLARTPVCLERGVLRKPTMGIHGARVRISPKPNAAISQPECQRLPTFLGCKVLQLTWNGMDIATNQSSKIRQIHVMPDEAEPIESYSI